MAKMDESFQRKYVKETIYILKSLKGKRKFTKTHKKLVKMIKKELKKYPKSLVKEIL
jgi:geranylgeranyl pyrophosphate synthase